MTVDKFLKIFSKCPHCKTKIGIEYPLYYTLGCLDCCDLACSINYQDQTELSDIRLYNRFGDREICCQFIFSTGEMSLWETYESNYLTSFICDETTMIKLFKRRTQLKKYLLLT